MSSIDRRVVEMEFDNKQFEQGIQDTLKSLEDLKQGLKLEGATQGLQELNSAGANVDLGGMAGALDHISSRFNAMGAVGFTVIQNLTTAVMGYVSRISGLVLDPLVAGGRRRAENIEQAKFQFRGLGVDVEKAMDDALYAVLGTAYGLDAAAKAASQLSASQVELGDDMKQALRGISGVAAMTNRSYEDTARVFTKVAGQGRLMGDDLNSLASRGLNAAATLATAFNVTEAEIRDMVSEGEISFDMFSKVMNDAFGENATKANETYAGSLSNLRAAFSRIGASFFTPHLENTRDLFNAITPVVDNLGKAMKPLVDAFVDLSTVRTTTLAAFLEGLDFSDLPKVITPVVEIFKDLFGIVSSIYTPIKRAFTDIFPPTTLSEIGLILFRIQMFVDSIKIGADSSENLRRTFAGVFAVFSIGWSVLKNVARFLFDIFGIVSDGSGGILEATANVGDFFVALDQAIKNGEGLTNFFNGLRDALEPPIRFVKELASAIFTLFDFVAPSPDELTASFEPLGRLGEILNSIWERVLASFGRVYKVIEPLIEKLFSLFGGVGEAIAEVFQGANFDQIMDVINTGVLGGVFLMFQRFADNLSNSFGSIQYNLTEPFKRLTFVLNTMQTTLRAMTLMQIAIAIGILAASVVALSKVDNKGLAKALTAISVMMAQLVASLKGLTLVGGTKGLFTIGLGLLLFAGAIRVLTSAVKALAELSWEELSKGLAGVTALIAGLVLAVKGMSGQTSNMISTGAGLLILAFGIKVLVSSVEDLAELSWEEMSRGLVGVGTLLGALAIFTRLSALNKGGIGQGAGLLLLALGIKILASAVEDFADLSWEEVGRGLASVTAILAAFTIFSQTVKPAGLLRAGASLVIIGGAMKILASALGDFAGMSWEEIGKGLLTMAGALTAIVLALNLMPPNVLASSVALIGVSVALGLIASALSKMGGMSWEEIGKGLVTLASSLAIIAVAMMAMVGALPGAAATLLVASALRIFAPVLEMFGKMSLGEIARGLGTLSAVFIILGAAGYLLAPLVPVFHGLAIAVAILGAGMLLAGAGVFAFSLGLTALATAGAAGTAALVSMVAGIIGLLPIIAKQLGTALVIFIQTVAAAAPEMIIAITKILDAVITAIEQNTPGIIDMIGDMALKMVQKLEEIVPQFAEAALNMMLKILEKFSENAPLIIEEITTLIVNVLEAMTDGAPKIAKAAADLMVAWLGGIEDNLDEVIDAGADVVIKLIRGIAQNSLDIVDAGMEAIVYFIDGVAKSIRENNEDLREAGKDLASAIASGLTGGLSDKVADVVSGARGLAERAIGAVRGVFRSSSPSKEFIDIGHDVGDGLAIGINNMTRVVAKSSEGVGKEAIDTMKKSIAGISDILALETDMDPTIRPVLDLTEFQKSAAQIDATLSGKQIAVDLSQQKAKNASIGYQANLMAKDVATTADDISAPAAVSYVQNNYSPKALTSAEIYRQTKNQLSKTKGALTPNVAQDA